MAKTAVIEMARASGLALVSPRQRDPRTTTTRGTGELIKEALDQGFARIVVGLGGQAPPTTGGAGTAQHPGGQLFGCPRDTFCPMAERPWPRLACIDVSPPAPKPGPGHGHWRHRRKQPPVRPHRGVGGLWPAEGGVPGDGGRARCSAAKFLPQWVRRGPGPRGPGTAWSRGCRGGWARA